MVQDGGDMMINFFKKKETKPPITSVLVQNSQVDPEVLIEQQEMFSNGKSKTNNEQFEKDGYLVIRNIWNPEDLKCEIPVERGSFHYHGKINKFDFNPVEQQVPGCLSRYSYPPYKFYHSQIRMKIEKEIGKKLFNTYYFDRFYFTGQELTKHMDRPSCEISATFHIGTNLNKCWPIWIKTPDTYEEQEDGELKIVKKGENRKVCLNPGDCIVYKGCERPHWRGPLESRYSRLKRLINKIMKKEDDTYYHQVFFHYVLADGIYSHFAGDML